LLALRALKLSGPADAGVLDTLAATYAEAGQFAEAAKTAQRGMELAPAGHDGELVQQLRARLKLYQSATPYREP